MQYFVTIYIHPMKINIPHAFLGLTHIHPNELDKIGNIEIEKYDMPRYDSFTQSHFNAITKERGKWHENIYPSILNDEFSGEGFFGFAPVESKSNHWGKVCENNQLCSQSK